MTHKEKKELYESFMDDVAKIVEKHINEMVGDNEPEYKYWRVDEIDPDDDATGDSFCVRTDSDVLEDEVIDLCLENELLDKWDLEEYQVTVEDITGDPEEMDVWADSANII